MRECLNCSKLHNNKKYCSRSCQMTHANPSTRNDVKEKISKATKGKPKFTDEQKLKMSETRKGRKYSESHKIAISEGLKGRTQDESTKAKISESLKDYYQSNGHHREGSKLDEYTKSKIKQKVQSAYTNYDYTEREFSGYRKLAIDYYGYRCCVCDKSDGFLVVHHIDSNNKNNELDNLAVLCVGCHNKAHDRVNSKLNEDFKLVILNNRDK